MRAPLSCLAGIHRVTTRVGADTRDLFVFDHHRSAFSLWCAAAAAEGAPLTLLSLDRHFDLATPAAVAPKRDRSLEELERFAREQLSPRNDDHVLAAMEAGALGDAIYVARSHRPDWLVGTSGAWRDSRGEDHVILSAPSIEASLEQLQSALTPTNAIALDVDLDCFTTLSDAHFDEVIAWDADLIRAFLRPEGSAPLWEAILARTRVVTLAREPFHCGGLGRAAELWTRFARVFFGELLGVPAP